MGDRKARCLKVLRLNGLVFRCCVGCFFVPGAFWRRRLACRRPNEDRSVELRPVLGQSTPRGRLPEFHTYGCRFTRRFLDPQRATPRLANIKTAGPCRPRGALGGGSRGWRGCKTSTGTHRRLGMRRGSPFSLDSVMNARLHEFAMLFCSIWRPGRAAEGGKRYQMAAYTSARRGLDTVDLSEAASHRGSAFLAPGRHDGSTTRLEVSFLFLATHASRIAGR